MCTNSSVKLTRAQRCEHRSCPARCCGVHVLVSVHCLDERHRTSRSDPPNRQMFKTSCAVSQRNHRQSNEIAAFHGYTSHCRRTRRIASCARGNPSLQHAALGVPMFWSHHLRSVSANLDYHLDHTESPHFVHLIRSLWAGRSTTVDRGCNLKFGSYWKRPDANMSRWRASTFRAPKAHCTTQATHCQSALGTTETSCVTSGT